MGPDFLMVGAPKCGTTSMAQYLDQHPDIYMVRGEPHYFGSDIEYNRPRLTARQYERLFLPSRGKAMRGERSTWYLYSQKAAGEIYERNPDALIIAMLRNPADMLHSLHSHYVQRGRRDDIEDFAKALAAEPARRAGILPAAARFPESLYYSSIPRYAEQLERFISRFGRERVKVLLIDDLREDPARHYREVLEFLGVDSSFQPDFRVHNASAPIPNTWLHRQWKASNLRYRLRASIPSTLYRAMRARRLRQRAAAASNQPRPRLDEGTRRQLNEQFKEEIGRLERLIDRDLSRWLS
jgi:hypothetical protein